MRTRDKLTLESVAVRAVSIPMRRPIVSKVGTYPEWPFILIDARTKEGIVGRRLHDLRQEVHVLRGELRTLKQGGAAGNTKAVAKGRK